MPGFEPTWRSPFSLQGAKPGRLFLSLAFVVLTSAVLGACTGTTQPSGAPSGDGASSEISRSRGPGRSSGGQGRAARGAARDLSADERSGGHTLSRHVGRSDGDLRARLLREPRIAAASTYSDRETAERVVGETLDDSRSRLDAWLTRRGERPNLVLDYRGDRSQPIGRSLGRREGEVRPAYDAIVVLRWDGGSSFFVLTSYPEVRR
jgi:hypothetical protein